MKNKLLVPAVIIACLCLMSACGDQDSWMSGTPLHSQWDIVIAGAGFSGLVAANIAAKGGLKVLVLERNGEPGGCAAISGGIIWAPESAEILAEYVPDGDAELQRSYCEHFGEAVSWLQSLDLPISQIEQLGSLGRGCVMTTGQSGDRHQSRIGLLARERATATRLQYEHCSPQDVLKHGQTMTYS